MLFRSYSTPPTTLGALCRWCMASWLISRLASPLNALRLSGWRMRNCKGFCSAIPTLPLVTLRLLSDAASSNGLDFDVWSHISWQPRSLSLHSFGPSPKNVGTHIRSHKELTLSCIRVVLSSKVKLVYFYYSIIVCNVIAQ
jgi:hypothetical protein